MTDINTADLRDGSTNIHSIGPDRAAGLLTKAADTIDTLRRDFAEARQLASRYGIELGPHFAAHSEHARTTGELRSNIPYLGTRGSISLAGEERGCQPGTCLAEPRCRNRAEMRAAHGTPAEFAASIARAAPELLGSEAERAIVTYNAAWAAAAEPSAEVQRSLNSELAAMGCNLASATRAEFKRALWSAMKRVELDAMGKTRAGGPPPPRALHRGAPSTSRRPSAPRAWRSPSSSTPRRAPPTRTRASSATSRASSSTSRRCPSNSLSTAGGRLSTCGPAPASRRS